MSGVIQPGRLVWPWLIVFTESPRPQFFLVHGRNLDKFEEKEKRKECKIVGRVGDEHNAAAGLQKAQLFCRRLNDTIPGSREDWENYKRRWVDNLPNS